MGLSRRRARSTTAWLAGACALLFLSGCAGPVGDATPSDPGTPPPRTPAATATQTPTPTVTPTPPEAAAAWKIGPNGQCDAGQLDFALQSRPMDSGMSQFYWNLQMTNTSDTACTLDGYPQVMLVSPLTGATIGAAAERDAPAAQSVVAMPPGASAYSLLHLRQAGAYGCATVPVTEVAVTPPYWDMARPVATPNQIDGCDDRSIALVSAGPLTATPAPG